MNTLEKRSLRDFVNRFQFDTAVTLDFDFAYFNSISLDSIKKTLKAWDAATNRRLFGKSWYKKPADHIRYFAFIEKPDSCPHIHLVCNRNTLEFDKFRAAGTAAWQRLRSTDHDTSGVHFAEIDGQVRWISYVTKTVTHETWLHSDEFKY